MKRVGDSWVTEEPDADKARVWNDFWKHMAGEIARIRLGQDASD